MKTRPMRMGRRGLLAAFCIAWIAYGATATIDSAAYLDDIKFLSSKELRGRLTGSPELEKAAAFISGKFREFGLKPLESTPARKSYNQAFPVTTDASLGSANRFHFTENGHAFTLNFREDFIPFNFSHAGKLAGSVVLWVTVSPLRNTTMTITAASTSR